MAWLLLAILIALIALIARADAAPAGDPFEQAIRYANLMTGVDPGAGPAAGADDAADLDDADDDGDDDDGEGDGEGDPDGRDLAGPAGELDAADVAVARLARAGSADGDDAAPASPVLAGLADDDDAAQMGLAMAEDDGLSPADALPGDAGSGGLAMLDAELDPGDPIAGLDGAVAAAPAGAAEVYEQWMRRHGLSRWGRLDVGVAWRTRWSVPMHSAAHRSTELWLVATWRR